MATGFDGLHVVVTGGTGALGTALVGQLIEKGAVCHIPCFHEAERSRFAHASSPQVKLATGVDLTDDNAVGAFYNQASAAGVLWASMHIAGGFMWGPIADTTPAQFESQWRMNALTCWLCCRAAVKTMRTGGRGGRIVNVTSRPGVSPENGASMTAYTAAKAAVSGLTVALAAEVAAEGILVNAVAPSIMDTPANRAAMPKADFATWPTVADVAKTICFLASPENTVTRGGLIPVYGKA